MKRMVLGMSLALVALGFVVAPARGASPPPAPALSDFLASLAAPAPMLAAKRPGIEEKGTSALNNCAAVEAGCASQCIRCGIKSFQCMPYICTCNPPTFTCL